MFHIFSKSGTEFEGVCFKTYIMNKLTALLFILIFIPSCEKSKTESVQEYVIRVTDYDLNCSNCIIEFPLDADLAEAQLGRSDEKYSAVNMSKDAYSKGTMLIAFARAATTDEQKACITLYPSHDYRSVFVTESASFGQLDFKDSTTIAYKDCLYNPADSSYLCFEKVISDSRCPKGVYCVQAGNAQILLKYFRKEAEPESLFLNTDPGAKTSAIVNGYQVSLRNLYPYPEKDVKINNASYRAVITVKKL